MSIVLSAALLAAPLSQLWTVGPGPADDFPTPAAALASPSVQDGDVLQVAKGTYPGFAVDKAVHIVGEEVFWVSGTVSADGVSAFTLARARPRYLNLSNLTGPARLVEVQVGEYASFMGTWLGGLWIESCSDVLAERSHFRGTDGCYPDDGSLAGVSLGDGSRLVLVDCTIKGGDAVAGGFCGEKPWIPGAPAVTVGAGSSLLVAGGTILGGLGGIFFADAAPAIRVDGVAQVSVRGRSSDLLLGGLSGASGAAPAVVIEPAAAGSSVKVSGLLLGLSGGLPAGVDWPSPPQPLLRAELPGPPGWTTVWLHGQSPLPGLLIAGSAGSVSSTPFGPLWLDLADPLPFLWLPPAGHESGSPVMVTLAPDPALAGLQFVLQGLVLELAPGRTELTNPILLSPGI